MPESVIPENVRRLLNERVHGYAAIEALLLLSSDPERVWTAPEIAAELKIANADADEALRALVLGELASETDEGEDSFIFRASVPGLADAVNDLGLAYSQNRVQIMRLMSTNAIERVRTSAARAFADAFVFGKKKDG